MTVTYLGIFIVFSLWISYQQKKGISSLFGLGTAILMIAYLVKVYMTPFAMEDKLGLMAVSMLLLAVYSALYSITKLSFLRIIILLSGLTIAYKVIHQTTSNSISVQYDEKAEILLKIDKSDFKSVHTVLIKMNYPISQAFTPSRENQTQLDDYYVINIPSTSEADVERVINKLNSISGIEDLQINKLYYETLDKGITTSMKTGPYLTNDPMRGHQWNLDILDYDGMIRLLNRGHIKPQKSAKLFILDSGIDSKHEDISGNYSSYDTYHDTDIKGHGTHCAGIAAATNNNQKGISSIIPSALWGQVTSIKVLGDKGYGSRQTIIEGMITAVDADADVISMSLGGLSLFGSRKLYDEAVNYANDRNVIVIVAAGNSNGDADQYSPANSYGSITVSAVDENNNKASFSNTVTNIEMAVAAPGTNILSSFPGNKYESYSGTSMATPHVAGLVTIMKSINPELTVQDIYAILNATGKNTQNTVQTGKLIQPVSAIERLISR